MLDSKSAHPVYPHGYSADLFDIVLIFSGFSSAARLLFRRIHDNGLFRSGQTLVLLSLFANL